MSGSLFCYWILFWGSTTPGGVSNIHTAVGWKGQSVEKMQGTLCWLLHRWDTNFCCGEGSPSREKQAGYHWRQSKCRDILTWDFATSSNLILPHSGTELFHWRWKPYQYRAGFIRDYFPSRKNREDGMACLKPNAVCDQAADKQEEVVGCCGGVWFFRMLISPLFIKYINIKLSACLVSSDFIYQIK